MKKLVCMIITVLSIPLVFGHATHAGNVGVTHNFAGNGLGFYILLSILIIGLLVYEKLGDSPLGHSVLWSSILIPTYIDLFFPNEIKITTDMVIGTIVILIVVLFINFRERFFE